LHLLTYNDALIIASGFIKWLSSYGLETQSIAFFCIPGTNYLPLI
jgi:hypothetical protein